MQKLLLILFSCIIIMSCSKSPWNNPYPNSDAQSNTLYSSFEERPKHLDPGRAYSANEYVFLAQIYEPPLQYHFLLRPYRLVPLAALEVPIPKYFDAAGQIISADAALKDIARSEYQICAQPHIRFQPHPAFARDKQGNYLYHALHPEDLKKIHVLADFLITDTRELTSADFIYQIKRLAAPWVHSPIAGVMREYIIGFAELETQLAHLDHQDARTRAINLRQAELTGVKFLNNQCFIIQIRGKYPQFAYWLAMPFFAPLPWEAEMFYAQPGLAERNITLDWYPVGTGPFYLTENNPNLRMILTKNPYFHDERYPIEGMPGDRESGLLEDAGKSLPFIERAVYSLEKEEIPRWNKFLQGYYDSSGLNSDAFDQAVRFDAQGGTEVTAELKAQGISLLTGVEPAISYLGFNMLDPVVGGNSERARLLRRAISIAVDYEEFISIFTNGRGIAAQGPIPPGIFGYQNGAAGINNFIYQWHDNRPVRRNLTEAQEILKQAGYSGGIDPKTGRALMINYEAVATGPDDRARLTWIRKQFAKLGIELIIRATDYNRFQEKMRTGTGQMFLWGWNADYPDPENFLFLLYGPNGKVEHQGENAANYANPEFDQLFEQMKFMDNGPERQKIIDRLVTIVRQDAPWIFGLHPQAFTLHHQWLTNARPNQMANNTLKYRKINSKQRAELRNIWNRPLLLPIEILIIFILLSSTIGWLILQIKANRSIN